MNEIPVISHESLRVSGKILTLSQTVLRFNKIKSAMNFPSGFSNSQVSRLSDGPDPNTKKAHKHFPHRGGELSKSPGSFT